ncbi:MAG: hypothetical protein HFJ27_04635 [Clostridia bacterium]|nr:hypothetical protein [Clostridia bacterium]
MESLKKSKVIKAICYSLVPILVLGILLNTGALIFYATYEEDFTGYKNYTDTERFAKDYLYNIKRAIRIAENEKQYIDLKSKSNTEDNTYEVDSEVLVIQETETQRADTSKIYFNFFSIGRYDILLISPEGNIITNVNQTVKTDTLEGIKNYILSKPYYWKYDLNQIETSIPKMQYEEIAYKGFEEIQKQEYEVYTALREESTEFYAYELLYDFVVSTYQIAPLMIVVLSILLIACIIYIFMSIGHK